MELLRNLMLAGLAALFLAPVARAADMPLPAPVVEDFGGWYLRGDLGITNQRLSHLDNVLFATAPDHVFLDKGGFDSGPLFGLGVGYKANNWLRVDLTGEYRGKAGFHALDAYTFDDSGTDVTRTNIYSASKSEWLFLLNAYLDLGTWRSVTPFVGAGIGAARVTISHFRDVDPTAGASFGPSVAFADSTGTWNFAWALHAGLAYQVTPTFAIEFAYRYVHLGNGKTGDLTPFDGSNAVFDPMGFKGISSQDLRFGARWMLADGFVPVSYGPPLIRKY